MLKPELLSPAGNLTKLKIALEYGADAVYASVASFSLRTRSAREFSLESFEEGIRYTHEKGKKFYVTINAFPFNGQIEPLKRHLQTVSAMKPDAFLISTPGVMSLAKEIAPDIDIHLSTQANVMNYLDARIYHEMGASRIVVAREMSLKDVIKIKEMLPNLEIEIFVHGSMCFAYSGRCLVSAVQSGRQSNRGSCANDCRFKYELYAKNPESGTLFRLEEDPEGGTHVMNAKDLSLISHIDEIVKSGVIDSCKIEGRTKSEYYAACATRAYRMAIDDAASGKFKREKYEFEINTLKNRGFTDGYLVSRPYERVDTQNHTSSLEEGTHQVHAISEDGEFIKCKFKIVANEAYEIVSPLDSIIEVGESELGSVYDNNGKFWLEFKQLVSKKGKIFEEIHSGNENEIKLPIKLPKFSFLRKEFK
ncbi:U32 family peptidase [Campylobacter sp. RM9344]|uniref:U32 family peptidase n=1 Tax=Campylobacter californiensis TaxID=1032243 RepID=A0AAW3ZRV8_9BACT|nr:MULTISPECIES: peptidase U32 family protein [unclassified Campylobacter]MBE2983980.1 U32 family peptidase [Campylobacter sp. RM6883]MBE2986142.1 U32 family peptidase [Campylobacter sp. RM12919]MBE2987554.1 U32 family peptidase [Campylobacter sp. RM12920]MBE2994518.1 U32 family peptidase [Campylobacter sp. RM6913]MBE3028826.1 U32 family peptidase [Campylobacter sp. RM9344]